jgi:uncharacterized protein YqhQ
MRRLRQLVRLIAHTQLLPVLESGDDPLIGGQAVMEGVMMRTPHNYCVAVRRPDGTIVTEEGPAKRLSETSKFWALPIVRGCGTLGQAMGLGMRALNFSAKHAVEEEVGKDGEKVEEKELPQWMMALNIAVSIGFFIFMYKFIPLLATGQIQTYVPALDNQVGFSVVEGVIRLAIFLTFLFAISRMKDIHRVFEYHGAEHKVVFNYESKRDVNVENAQSFVTWHPRCGTSFLMVVMVVAIVFYALIPFDGFFLRFASRLALLPVIAGISYEIIRFAAKHQGGFFENLVRPGLWLQRITTQSPDDTQVEISIRALQDAMALEEKTGGTLVVA